MSILLILSIGWLNMHKSTAFQIQYNKNQLSKKVPSYHRNAGVLLPRTTSLHAIASEGEVEEETSTTTFTLSFGDVEFCLTPDTMNNLASDVMSISKLSNGQVSINLNNFSGNLHVKGPRIIEDVNDGEIETIVETQPKSKASIRYEEMLSNFRLHSEADFNLVASPRYRGLLRGTSAAINDPKVILAFKVLYEDIGPIRVAGDLIFSKLERELAKSKGSDGAASVKALGRDDSCVIAARKIFDAVDADASGTVSSQELLESDLLRSLGQCEQCTCGKEGSCQSVQRFMDEIDKTHPKGELHFDEFLLASHHLLFEGDATVSLFGGDGSADDLVDEILNGKEGPIGKEKADRYSNRFDKMCDEFDSWDSADSSAKAQSSNPRLALVLDGCFAGSRNPPVVDALKILYIDFRPLRMAGDLIFKMMRKLARG